MLKKRKRMFATVLAMMMLITTMVVPTSVFAEEETNDVNMRQDELFRYNGVDEVYLGAFKSDDAEPVSYTHLTLPTIAAECRSRWSPYH